MANLKSLLKENATEKKPGAKKSTMPVLKTTGDLAQKVNEYVTAKVEYKKAEAIMKVAEAPIIEFVRAKQDAEGFAGRYTGSYEVEGDGESVKVIFQDKYTVTGEDEAEIKGILGGEFEHLMEEKFTVSIKPEVLDSEDPKIKALIKQLIDGGMVDIAVKLTPKPDFKKNIYRAVDANGLNNLRTFVKQYKPSMK
jgi:hypothetical protein